MRPLKTIWFLYVPEILTDTISTFCPQCIFFFFGIQMLWAVTLCHWIFPDVLKSNDVFILKGHAEEKYVV